MNNSLLIQTKDGKVLEQMSWEQYLALAGTRPDVNSIKADVIQMYQKQSQLFLDRLKAERAEPFLKELTQESAENIDFINIQNNSQAQVIIDQIRRAGIQKYIPKGTGGKNDPANGFNISKKQAKEIKTAWEGLVLLAKNKNWSGAGKHIERLSALVEELNKQIQDSSIANISLAQVIGRVDKNNASLAASIQGTLNALMGLALEGEITSFLQKNIPSGVTYQTGAITVNGASIKEDIMTLITDNLQLTNDQGEVVYIFKDGKIYNGQGAELNKEVKLTPAQYESLQEATGLGYSAKTTSGTIIFHSGYNLEERYGHLNYDPRILQLIHFYQYDLGKNVSGAGYWQRYAIIADIERVIGKKNIFLVSGNKIIPTYKYLDSLVKDYNKQLHFKPAKIAKEYAGKGKTIVGGKFS